MTSGMVPALSLRQELAEAKAENTALRLELEIHRSGLKRRLNDFGAAWACMRIEYNEAVQLRMAVYGETLAESCDAVWLLVLTAQQRAHFLTDGERLVESMEAFNT